ncbi:MAG: lyase family protein, partial [Bilophila wadsworthia]
AGIRRNRLLRERERARWSTGVLGATAVGTGMGCMPGFSEHIYKNLSAICGREIRRDANLFDGLQASDSFIILHAHLQALATVAAKAALDIRLMGSGPRAGFGDIVIPAVQPGSSIMPGKINPVMTEVMIWLPPRSGQSGGRALAFSGPRRLLRRPIRSILNVSTS